MHQWWRTVAARELVSLDQDISIYPVEALGSGWFRGKFYVPPGQRDSFASVFQSVGIPFRGAVKMHDVNNVIPAALAVPGVSVAVRSATTLRATELASGSSSGTAQVPQDRHRSLSPRGRHQSKHSTPSKSCDLTVRPKQEPEDDMPSVPRASRNLPSEAGALSYGRERKIWCSGPYNCSPCSRRYSEEFACDCRVLRRISWEHEARQALRNVFAKLRSQMPVATTAAQTFPAGRESLSGGLASTSVVRTATAPRMAVDEATSEELLTHEQFRKEMHHRERKHARHLALIALYCIVA